MVAECWAITIIILAMAFVFLRAHRKGYALAVLPLTLVPFAHGVWGAISRYITISLIAPATLSIGVDLTAAAISCVLLGVTCNAISEKKQRLTLLICGCVFVLVLAWVLLLYPDR